MIALIAVAIGILLFVLLIRAVQRLALLLLIGGLILFSILMIIFLTTPAAAVS